MDRFFQQTSHSCLFTVCHLNCLHPIEAQSCVCLSAQFEDEDDEGDDEVDEIVDTDDDASDEEDATRVLQGTNVDVDDGGEAGG